MEPVLTELALQHEAAGRLSTQAELHLLDAVGHGHLGQVGGPEGVDGLHFFLLFGFEGRYDGGGVPHLFEALLQVTECVWVKAPPFFFHELLDTFPFALAVAVDTYVHTGAEDLIDDANIKSCILKSEFICLFIYLSTATYRH